MTLFQSAVLPTLDLLSVSAHSLLHLGSRASEVTEREAIRRHQPSGSRFLSSERGFIIRRRYIHIPGINSGFSGEGWKFSSVPELWVWSSVLKGVGRWVEILASPFPRILGSSSYVGHNYVVMEWRIIRKLRQEKGREFQE